MKTCMRCDHDVLEEDIYTCDKCGCKVCSDCIVNISDGPDDLKMVCKSCVKGGE